MLNLNLLQRNDKIIVGMSGGPDSVCLAYLLNQLKDKLNLTLHLVHVNYMLRGDESIGDQHYCEDFAEKYDLPLTVHVFDMSDLNFQSVNIQKEARRFRMEIYNDTLSKLNFDKIAIGHTRDDSVETVLGNIMRGCGLDGLSGLEEKSDHIIRPLLHVSKTEIMNYLDDNKIEYRIDSSNLKSDYTRNKIRNELLPHIKEVYNPNIEQAIIRLSQISGEVNEYLLDLTVNFIGMQVQYSNLGTVKIPISALQDLPPVLIRPGTEKINRGNNR